MSPGLCGAKSELLSHFTGQSLHYSMNFRGKFAPQFHVAFILCSVLLWSNVDFTPQIMEQCRLCTKKSEGHSFIITLLFQKSVDTP